MHRWHLYALTLAVISIGLLRPSMGFVITEVTTEERDGTMTRQPDGSEVETETFSLEPSMGATRSEPRHPDNPERNQTRSHSTAPPIAANSGTPAPSADHGVTKDTVCAGCPESGNVRSKAVLQAAKAALKLINAKASGRGDAALALHRVLAVKKQVVAGLKYFLTIEAGACIPSTSASDPGAGSRDGSSHGSACSAGTLSTSTHVIKAQVWDQPWRHPRYELLSSTSDDSGETETVEPTVNHAAHKHEDTTLDQDATKDSTQDATQDQITFHTASQEKDINRMDPEQDEEAAEITRDEGPFGSHPKRPAHVVPNKIARLTVAATGGGTYHSPAAGIVVLVVLAVGSAVLCIMAVAWYYSRGSPERSKVGTQPAQESEDECLTQPLTSDDDLI